LSGAVRYRAVVAYVGTRFHGWQTQKNAPRTVQATLEAALKALARGPVRVEGASRTDAGVHADGQVAHFDLPRRREPRAVRDGANDRLPDDVRLLSVEEAAAGFHARFDASWKEYVYRWSRAPVIAPKDAPFAAPLSPRADAERMREAAACLPGRKDFRIFAVAPGAGEDTVRTLRSVVIEEDGEELRAVLRGDGFLRGMARSICGVLADASRGRVPRDRALRLLETGDRGLLCAKALARGLTLRFVSYDSETLPGPLSRGREGDEAGRRAKIAP
jgi:tRNA pseudouridine38-40 synthase